MSDLSDLLGMAKNEDPQVRAMVAKSIATIQDSAALSTLVDLLSDPDERVRVVAIASLGQSRQQTAIEPLLPLLDDDSLEIQCSAIAALAEIGGPRAFNPVVVRLFDINDEIRKNAAAAVGCMKDARGLEPLMMCLDDENEWVRANAALSLGQLMRANPIPALINLANSEDTETVRGNAVSALGSLAAFLSDSEDEEEQQAVSQALASIFEILDDVLEMPKVRIAAQLALANGFEQLSEYISPAAESAFELTGAVAASDSSDDDLRSTAVWSLGKMLASLGDGEMPQKREAAFDVLVAKLDDPHEWCVRYAIEALAASGDSRAKESIETFAVRDEQGQYRELCDMALEAIEKSSAKLN